METITKNYSPLVNPRYDELERWITPERIKKAWEIAKEEMAKQSRYPTLQLSFMIQVERRTIYGWTSGAHRPQRLSLVHLDDTLSRVIGEDWPAMVDRALEGA